MQCRVCGADTAKCYQGKRLTLCDVCKWDTPDKVSRDMFDRLYWGINYSQMPDNVRHEFYSDYLHSAHTLDEYVIATTEDA